MLGRYVHVGPNTHDSMFPMAEAHHLQCVLISSNASYKAHFRKTKRYILCTKYCVHCAYTQSSPLWLNSTSCSSSVLDLSMPIKSYQIMIKKFVLTRETFSGYEICRSYTHIEIYWITPIHWLMRINEINYNYLSH